MGYFSIFEFTTTYILYTICFSYITRINKNELNKPGKADLQVKENPSCAIESSLQSKHHHYHIEM
jgi:hypothetical protein